MGKIIAVCMSETRGAEKKNIGRAYLKEDWGLEGDAHAGHWHRQVSLLSYDKVEEFNARGAGVTDGAFGENLLVAGIDFPNLPAGTRLMCSRSLRLARNVTTAAPSGSAWATASCRARACLPACCAAVRLRLAWTCSFVIK
mgnify:CR=1 FL=1